MTTAPNPNFGHDPDRTDLESFVAHARRLRSRAMADGLRHAIRAVREGVGARRQPESAPLPGPSHGMRGALSAIRSSAEILRDNPGMAPAERARFVEILLSEERRLERLLGALMPQAHQDLARR